ncbi:hypothetical protein [Phaeobacter piscinae]|uniref:hypothetical protein n=1 Tax=Phaeobacter piscinae TaxID=1580596 RepID=UPI000BBFE596|nr:hypothetical protein [Phaeobacter piscinae]ATG41717.1 hypothetical protein PhaeoP14_03685 [Phaeobacter piscinae]AUR38140.1 hypothetical protein PhaeoP18_03924 [Phaeobacter piscinae]
MKTIKRAVAVAGLMGLAGCMGNTSQTSANIMGLQSMAGVQRAAQAQPSEKDLAMSCSEVKEELGTLYARSEAINKAERKRERKANLTGGLMEAGLSVLGAGAIANAGSAQSISNVGTATAVAGTAASGVRGSGGPDAQTYNTALAIAERSALLERVKLANGC